MPWKGVKEKRELPFFQSKGGERKGDVINGPIWKEAERGEKEKRGGESSSSPRFGEETM